MTTQANILQIYILRSHLQSCVNVLKTTGLHAFTSIAKAVQKTADLRYQRNIFAYTFEPPANDPQIHGCLFSLYQEENVVKMWHLPSLLRTANLVQYQSLLLGKFEPTCTNVVFATHLL